MKRICLLLSLCMACLLSINAQTSCFTQPNFIVDRSSGVCVSSLTSNFTADSSAPGFTYTWFVNNQQIQSNTSRRFTYTFPASLTCYDIKLRVSNNSGCADSLTRPGFICVYPSPQLSFTQNATSACVDSGQSFELCLNNNSKPFPPIEQWRISGGNPVVNLGPFVGDSICVTLVNPGSYKVTLIIPYGSNCIDSLVVPNAFILHRAPTPCFYADSTWTCQTSLTTRFYNCSTTPPGSSHIWNFGAGSVPVSSNIENPLTPVTYFGLGARNVSLTVTAPNGCSRTRVGPNYINIDTIKPLLLVTPATSGCAPLDVTPQSITFIPPGVGNFISRYEFWIYRGTVLEYYSPNGSAFTRTYYTPGCYDIKMRITTSYGCVSTTWQYNAFCVGEPQTGGRLNVSSTQICSSDSVSFAVSGPIQFSELQVHYGDEVAPPDSFTFIRGGVSAFHHTYAPGEYDVWIVPLHYGCPGDTMRQHIRVKPPLANFVATTSCLTGDLITFQNQSIGAIRYHWSFGCKPDTFNTTSPSLIFPHCDTCTINLTAYNDTAQCTDKLTRTIQTACTGVDASFSPDTVGLCGVSTTTTRFTNTTPGAVSGVTRWDWDDGSPSTPGTSSIHSFYPGVYHIKMIYTAPGGCVDTAYGLVANCDMHIDFGPTYLCLPDSFHFNAAAFDTVAVGGGCDSLVRWKWTFSNAAGDTSNESNPVHYFPQGNYAVTLTATNQYGCTSTITKTIVVGTLVTSFVKVDTNICPGSTICIDNSTSSGSTITETWQFPGSGSGSFNGPNPPCLTYNTAGDYPLIHNYTAGTCSQSDTIYIHVCPPKVSGYLTANHASCPNPPVQVCGVNTSQCVDSTTDIYTWHFGNAEYLEVNPCHTYTQPGYYPVTLSVLTDNGCRDTAFIDSVYIGGPYVSSYTVTSQKICFCDTVHYEIATVGATSINFVYGCNQGFEVISQMVPGTVAHPTILRFAVPYCTVNACMPQITLSDGTGCQVLFNFPTVYVDTPVVDFKVNSNGTCSTGPVCFTDSTSFVAQPDSNSVVDWMWTFGDGSGATSTLQNPCHVYSQKGSYPVTLTVNSALGCTGTATKTLNLHGPPKANFSYELTSDTCNSANVCFNDFSTADSLATLMQWVWCFTPLACDTFSAGYNCNRFNAEGVYPVKLTAIDEAGCVDDTILQVTVPTVHYLNLIATSSRLDSCSGVVVCYTTTGTAESSALSYRWEYGDSTYRTPQFCNYYTTAGNKRVDLRVTDNVGCYSISSVSDQITPPAFNASFTYTINGSVVTFTNTSQGNIDNRSWQFGDGGTSSLTNPQHTYTPGTYQVTLSIFDAAGCQRQVTQTITIQAVDLKSIVDSGIQIGVTPNPFSSYTTFLVSGPPVRYQLNLTTLLGQQVHSDFINANEPYQLHRNKLTAGIYQYILLKGSSIVARGKVVIQ